jgi:hypothetical protein
LLGGKQGYDINLFSWAAGEHDGSHDYANIFWNNLPWPIVGDIKQPPQKHPQNNSVWRPFKLAWARIISMQVACGKTSLYYKINQLIQFFGIRIHKKSSLPPNVES